MSSRIALKGAVAGAVLLLAIPGVASAVTGSVAKPCVSHIPTKGSEPIVVTLAGGTPGADFQVAATIAGKGRGSAGSTTGTFDAAGNGTAAITDVFPPSGSIDPIRGEPVAISAMDFGAPGAVDTPIGATLVTNLALDVALKPRRPSAKRTITVSGTPFAGRQVYGFVVRGSGRKVLKRISLGTADGCGYARAKAVVAPKHYRHGNYRLYVNAGPTLNKDYALGFGFRIYSY
ncbi:MAG: hypothetical protein QOG42_1315 [Solirubrobacteraceae bacterium]|nr:hypothetical protein [Solirubrobacteraceae bacterium]